MKCLKNNKTGNIIRVDDAQANQMVGNTWAYVAKSEWKGDKVSTPTPTVEEKEVKEKTKTAKSEKASKFKSKQRQ